MNTANAPGLNAKQQPLYDSPFCYNTSKAAINGSKLNHSVAKYLYGTEEFASRLKASPDYQVNKSHNLRHTGVDGFQDTAANRYRDAAIKAKESYEAKIKIDDNDEFMNHITLTNGLQKKVLKLMLDYAETTSKHKIFGTDLPTWYITNVIFFTLLEQEYAITYGEDKTNIAFRTPIDVCEMLYDLYTKETFDASAVASDYNKFLDDPKKNFSYLNSAINKIDFASLKQSDPAYYPILVLATAMQMEGDYGNNILAAIGSSKRIQKVSIPQCVDFNVNIASSSTAAYNELSSFIDQMPKVKELYQKMKDPIDKWNAWCSKNKFKLSSLQSVEALGSYIDQELCTLAYNNVTEDNDTLYSNASNELTSYSRGDASQYSIGKMYLLLQVIYSLCHEKNIGKETYDNGLEESEESDDEEEPIDIVILESGKAEDKYVVGDDVPIPNDDFITSATFAKMLEVDKRVSDEVSRRIYGNVGEAVSPISEPLDNKAQMIEAYNAENQCTINDPKSWEYKNGQNKPLRLSDRNDLSNFEQQVEHFTDSVHKAAEITNLVCICVLVVVLGLMFVFLYVVPRVRKSKEPLINDAESVTSENDKD